jgi:phosphoribosylformylglycinamidine synthase
LALSADDGSLNVFRTIAERENCPFAVVGRVTDERQLIVEDDRTNVLEDGRQRYPVNCSMDWLFHENDLERNERKRLRSFSSNNDKLLLASQNRSQEVLKVDNFPLDQVIDRLLFLPAIASKLFLITIGDRSVGGLVSRDQLVGPFQGLKN